MSQHPAGGIVRQQPAPYCTHGTAQWNPAHHLTVTRGSSPIAQGTLGDVGLTTEVRGTDQFPLTVLVIPFAAGTLTGFDPESVRVFRWDAADNALRPVWNSGLTNEGAFVWAKITRPGLYVPIGLPRDRLLQELLRALARERRLADTASPESHQEMTVAALAPFQDAPEDELLELRRLVTNAELHTGARHFAPGEFVRGHGGHIRAFHLPRGEAVRPFKERVAALRTPPSGLPEEALFYPPESLHGNLPPWDLAAGTQVPMADIGHFHPATAKASNFGPLRPCWFMSSDWWMYHHDTDHSGGTSGCSDITSTSAKHLYLVHSVPLVGTIRTIPSIVGGKVYVGTSDAPGSSGAMHRIDLSSGMDEATYPVSGSPFYSITGIGGSPAIVEGKVYFSGLHGMVYCIDAATFAFEWSTDLRNVDMARGQPVHNTNADCWSSPLVVNGKVYVGCGEGEAGSFGFVYCLEAASGHVIWLFCTNRFTAGVDNGPNVIPASAAGVAPLPVGFSTHPDPPVRGVSVWSSCAYDAALNRIYVGTGNSLAGDSQPLPDAYYGSGVLALDADTGAFRGFFEPDAADCYRPDDTDVDICGSPLLFTRGATRVLGIGSKSGAYFLLDPATMTPLARRQLLPKDANTNLPLESVDAHGFSQENDYGVFGTGAVHGGLHRLFVGLGEEIDSSTTPFMRALDWNTLADVWMTSVDPVGTYQVARYTVPRPPMYATSGEAGLSSPAVVNDVVLVSTNKPGLYALDAATGLLLWSADGLQGDQCLGPAIYGNYVVVGCGSLLNIYTLANWRPPVIPPIAVQLPPWWRFLPPPPPPPPDGDGWLQQRRGTLGG
jgi:outer membrane protein assembly factor BamB